MKEKERHELFSRSKINDISLLDGRKNKYVCMTRTYPLVLQIKRGLKSQQHSGKWLQKW